MDRVAHTSPLPNTDERHAPWPVECGLSAGACSMLRATDMGDMLFAEAFEVWLGERLIVAPGSGPGMVGVFYLAPRTIKDYRACAAALGKFFGCLKVRDIHAGHLRKYQQARAYCDKDVASWSKPCGANRIRKEVALLLCILRDAQVWNKEDDRSFRRIRRVESDVSRAMQPEEQKRFLAVAASREEWQLILWYALVALQTTASTNELRALRIGDVLLEQRLLHVRAAHAKNKYRIRTIPLETEEVVWALSRLIERARMLGASAPHHFLFPIQEAKGRYDPNRSMSDSGLYKRWRALRSAAGLEWLRPYDLRHTAITRMAEAGVPIQVIMSFAGHMTLTMQQHYTAISMMAKRGWARIVWEESAKIGPGRSGANQYSNGREANFFDVIKETA